MKKNFLVCLFVCSVILFLAGCGGGEGPKGKAFLGGTSALELEFVEGNPPTEVTDSNTFPFNIIVLVKNEGEWDVSAEDVKKFWISGIDPASFNDFDESKDRLNQDLTRTYLDPDGEKIQGGQSFESFTEEGLAVFTGQVGGNNIFPVHANICYTYGAKGQGEVCIRENPLETTVESVCDITGTKKIDSSSSPIQFGNLQESPQGTNQIRFLFDVNHQGSGGIFDPDSVEPCKEADVVIKNKVKVKIALESPGELVLNCAGFEDAADGEGVEGKVTLINGKATVQCTVDTSGVSSDFTKIVKLTAVYDYKDSTATTLLVKPVVA